MTADEYRCTESLFDPTNTKAPKSLIKGQVDKLFAIAIDALFDTTLSDAEANSKVDDYNGFIFVEVGYGAAFLLNNREGCRKAGLLPSQEPSRNPRK